jgi:hypothetical protein
MDAKIYCIATLCLDKRCCGHYFKATIHRLDASHLFPRVPCIVLMGDDDAGRLTGSAREERKSFDLGNLPCNMWVCKRTRGNRKRGIVLDGTFKKGEEGS